MSSGLRSSRAAKKDGFGLEIWQHDGVRYVEFPLTCWHNSKRGNQARKKRGRERDERAKEGYGGFI
jgi:hypothetical protein